MKKKAPEDLLISYPTRRASPGVKAKARDTAIEAGHKSFYWNCPRHGMTVFSTAGAGVCRCCIAAALKKSKDHRNAAARVRSAAKKAAALAKVTEASQQRLAYLAAMAKR